jgi:hypothetical protein
MTTPKLVRGCGVRQPGGAYLVAQPGPGGIPIERLVVDPPRPIDPVANGLASVGMACLPAPADRPGPAHVLDWVGETHYPNVADFIEEGARFGFSRRVPTTFNFAGLGPGSRHALVHPRALVLDDAWLRDNPAPGLLLGAGPLVGNLLHRLLRRAGADDCPFNREHEAEGPDDFCAAWWWELLEPATVVFGPGGPDAVEAQSQRDATVRRRLPSMDYDGYCLPDREVWRPVWTPGIFLTLPITRIEVVRDPGDMSHEITLSRASRASLPILEVDE